MTIHFHIKLDLPTPAKYRPSISNRIASKNTKRLNSFDKHSFTGNLQLSSIIADILCFQVKNVAIRTDRQTRQTDLNSAENFPF